MLFGLDVSKHQGTVDFAAARAGNDMRFAIVKATEGKDYEDPRFRDNWRKLLQLDPAAAGEAGMVRGVYHFARPDLRPDQGRSAGELEARWLVTVLGEVGGFGPGCFPPALDWEKYPGSPSATNREWIAGFVNVIQGELGVLPMIYTGANVWYYTTGDTDAFNACPLWQVNYSPKGSQPDAEPRLMPRVEGREPWPWSLWQWSGGGDFRYYKAQFGPIAGIPSGSADVNRFDGTWEELLALAQAGPIAPPPIVTPPGPSVPEGGIMPIVDLAKLGTSERHELAAVVQGLLMANGYGPGGLVGADGLPDGKPGAKTLEALRAFQLEHGLVPCSVVDPMVWWMLLRDH
jgi:GH25 family lysozyme M1 (1,4-beta-N-acetylmuramidase)